MATNLDGVGDLGMLSGKRSPRGKARKVRHVVILGGGIVGASVARELRVEHDRRKKRAPFDLEITIVECTAAARRCPCGELGCDEGPLHALGANSGSDCGWLERDACDGTALESLAHHGFDAHVELGEHLGEDVIDYRRLQHVHHSATIGGGFGQEHAVYERPPARSWVQSEGGEVMSGSTFCKACSFAFAATPDAFTSELPCAQTEREGCGAPMPAQVHPRKLVWELVKEAGATVVIGTEAIGVFLDGAMPKANVKGVKIRPAPRSAATAAPLEPTRSEPEPEPEWVKPQEQQPIHGYGGHANRAAATKATGAKAKAAAAAAADDGVQCPICGMIDCTNAVCKERATEAVAGTDSKHQEVWPPNEAISSSLSSGILTCTDVVVAMGPWSAVASTKAWFEDQGLHLPLSSTLSQSVIVRPQADEILAVDLGDEEGPVCVAMSGAPREIVLPPTLPIADGPSKVNEILWGGRGAIAPFILPRPADATADVWVGGTSQPMGAVMVPDREGVQRMMLAPAQHRVKCSALVIGALRGAAVEVAPSLAHATHVKQAARIRSHTTDGRPVIGAVQRCAGAYVACGHGEHGLLTALAGGRGLAQLLLDGGKPLPSHAVDLTPFNALRL